MRLALIVACLAALTLSGPPCAARPTPPATACEDRAPPPGAYTCAQQAGWGKCGEPFMQGFCARACGRCGSGNSTSANSTSGALPAASSNAAAASPAPAPANATAPAPSAGLPGSVAQYAKALELSWRFYYAQRSGRLSAAKTNPVPWRGDSHLHDPVVGGFYDAGDHLKLNFPMATSLAFLAWGMLEFPEGYAAAGQAGAAIDNLRWGADYLMACHPSDDSYIAQIGNPGPDHAYWGRPEDDASTPRPAYTWGPSQPASDAAGAAASALAAISLAARPSDPAYAATCLDHARRLFAFASKYEGKYSDSQPSVAYVYMSSSYLDDLAFAAAWLYRATGEEAYLAAARGYLKRAQYQRNYYLSWDSVYVAADLLLLGQGVGPSEGVDSAWQVDAFVQSWTQGQNGIKFSPRGLAIAPLGGWGNNRYAANAAFAMVLRAKQAADPATRAACLAWARTQLDYMLGLAGSDRSYVVGFGANPPTHEHHRGASCPDRPAPCGQAQFDSPAPNPQLLAGALVGGPNEADQYRDVRSDYQANEVGTEYNAGYTSALAGLIQLLNSGLPASAAPQS